eukprot:6064262-Amphidinium_carterae.1
MGAPSGTKRRTLQGTEHALAAPLCHSHVRHVQHIVCDEDYWCNSDAAGTAKEDNQRKGYWSLETPCYMLQDLSGMSSVELAQQLAADRTLQSP